MQRCWTHHTLFSLFTWAGGADELLKLKTEFLIFTQNLIKLLHKVLSFAWVWEILWEWEQAKLHKPVGFINYSYIYEHK